MVLDDADGPVVQDFETSSRSAPPFEVTREVQLTSYGYLFRSESKVAGRPAGRPAAVLFFSYRGFDNTG